MIQSFKHAGLKLFHERASARKLTAAQAPKIKRVLTALEAARTAQDMNLPGFGLHPLRGDLAETW
jgi:proteic killer suppression protein